jgi:hypothetical protein
MIETLISIALVGLMIGGLLRVIYLIGWWRGQADAFKKATAWWR